MHILRKKIIIFPLFICVLIFGVLFFLNLGQKKQVKNTIPIPSPTPISITNSIDSSTFTFSPYQKTIIGKTTDEEVKKLANILNQQKTSSNEILYTIKSVDPLEPDIIVTKNNLVVFEKTNTITQDSGGLPKISTYIERFGKPDEEIVGSKTFGAFATNYIFATKGFTLIGNSATDNVYQIQRFQPMSLEEYKITYGQDINISQKQLEN